MSRMLSALRREDGFTLTELLVVLPVLSILLAAVVGTLIVFMSGNTKTTGQLTEQQAFFPTLDAMMQDVRTAMPPALGGSPLIAATATAITFYSPDRGYALTGTTSPFHLREIAYRFSGGSLQRQFITSTNTYTTVTSTLPWGSWTSAAGSFPVATFPSSTSWQTLLGAGLASDGSSPAIASASFAYYDGNGNSITAPVSAANLGLVRTIQVTVSASSGGAPAAQTSYTNTATIRETQPTT